MKLWEYISTLNKEDIIELLDKYESLGPLPGFLLPFVESFLPFLPIIVIVMGNAAAYGLWKGFLFSWTGVVTGSLCIFALTRRFGRPFAAYIHRKFPRGKAMFEWMERKGFTPIFVMACFPFTPSFLLNAFAGLTRISFASFLLAIVLGKAFNVFLISLVGFDIFSIFYHPWRLVFVVSLFSLIWVIGRKIEAHYRVKYRMK